MAELLIYLVPTCLLFRASTVSTMYVIVLALCLFPPECPHPEDGSSSSSPEQWALTDVARLPQLATAERLARKEALRSKNCMLLFIFMM